MKSIIFAAAGLIAAMAILTAQAQTSSPGAGSSMSGGSNAPITGQQGSESTSQTHWPQTTKQRAGSDPTGQPTGSTVDGQTSRPVPPARGAAGGSTGNR